MHISIFFLNENFLDTFLVPKTLFGYISRTKNTFWIHFYFWPNFCSVLKSSFSFLDMLWLEVTSHKQFLINSSYVSSEEINLVFKSIQKNTRFAGVPLDATAEPWRERQTAFIHFMFKKQINLTLGVPYWFWIRGVFFLIIHNNNLTESLCTLGISFRFSGREDNRRLIFWILKNQKLLITLFIIELEPFWKDFWIFILLRLF